MTKINIYKPASLAEILAIVEVFQNSREASWYRGTGNSDYSLVPTITRRTNPPSPEDIKRIERDIGNRFAQRAPPFVDASFANDWKMLFYMQHYVYMQHYGIPTRLLDWTESPFVGLYFALTSVVRNKGGKPSADAALWLCDPIAWNRTSLGHISFSGGVLDENCEEIKAYSPSAEVDQRATVPIMIYGTHNSPRIVAQRGVFALFGKGVDGMQDIFEQGNFTEASLEKIVIDKSHIDSILESLHRKGFAESTIYPDVYGLSLEIKRSFGYH